MFGRNANKGLAAQAVILDEGTLIGKPQLNAGYAYGNFNYQVEVRPPGQPTHRAMASGLACTGCKPEPGDRRREDRNAPLRRGHVHGQLDWLYDA